MPGKVIPWLKVVVHLLCLLPLLKLLMMFHSGALAAESDPVQFLTHFTGLWALWLLVWDLAITPVRRLSPKLSWLIRFRRMVGLYSFFYATLHMLVYVFLFSGYDTATALEGIRAHHWGVPWQQLKLIVPSMIDDVKQRAFIQVGLITWVLLLALAITSPQRVLRAMGGKNWQRLHRVVYVAGFLALMHFWWSLKKGNNAPAVVSIVFFALMIARLVWTLWQKRKKRARMVTA
ncbi:sulfite oxidase heme-binding subunit YedZ [Granulicella cerasi]|uniref:Protein-methionine-sulfoxide reductase heme-binding subunit MsrQ n=1 Tax=Granulicella cerasi TaxID=741063 RepID=A0ABW1ZBQ0_9BACT|nr:protein-methionine-sulfoxide reductase heme-binding subunit MsrQ [Granulicella cerasi]